MASGRRAAGCTCILAAFAVRAEKNGTALELHQKQIALLSAAKNDVGTLPTLSFRAAGEESALAGSKCAACESRFLPSVGMTKLFVSRKKARKPKRRPGLKVFTSFTGSWGT